MKNVVIQLHYNTHLGQSVYIEGSISQLGYFEDLHAKRMQIINDSVWEAELLIPKEMEQFEFSFIIEEQKKVVRKEDHIHICCLGENDIIVHCLWQSKTSLAHFGTSMFKNSIFKRDITAPKLHGKYQHMVFCSHVKPSEELAIVGNSEKLGAWKVENALALKPIAYGVWSVGFDNNIISEYKYAIRNIETKELVEWEDGENRLLDTLAISGEVAKEEIYRKKQVDWKASGIAIPIFSLKSEKSFGIGEFSDLNLLINWAHQCQMKVIQVLPINDTTSTYSWNDSYPYNAISIYALHPIYLGLHQYPLKDEKLNTKYKQKAEELNNKSKVDYDGVLKLKTEYITVLFGEIGANFLNTKEYKYFQKENEEWLLPYAIFCYFRDKYSTAKTSNWEEFSIYNKEKIEEYIYQNKSVQKELNKTYFTQCLLHQQLTKAKEFAYSKGIVLKGDIPIGVSPNSVEAWTEPHLFNLDYQTGAPPDDFSVNGQNWGFPTYNWAKMKETNYNWWTKRLLKMADYFDAYRIDHILGFFRIWEIPEISVHGLLGYFSPALPLSPYEIREHGFKFDEYNQTVAKIHREDAHSLFGKYFEEVISTYCDALDEEYFILKEIVDNQQKIKKLFSTKSDEKTNMIRDGLYNICDEVLFIEDKYNINHFHPRISVPNTFLYQRLNEEQQEALNNLYNDYYYHRHSSFWREEAMSKLPTLINATDMLVCGEDLGMVPESVPSVMNDLQILSLEIQRMPKENVQFGDLTKLPYLSVATTSTHDMSPLRMWWEEDAEITQTYYNNQLNEAGYAPKECDVNIAAQVIEAHLQSPAMLAILPFQDWLAMSNKLRRRNPNEERINQPSNPKHNWNYRMHLTLEELIKEEEFSELLSRLNKEYKR